MFSFFFINFFFLPTNSNTDLNKCVYVWGLVIIPLNMHFVSALERSVWQQNINLQVKEAKFSPFRAISELCSLLTRAHCGKPHTQNNKFSTEQRKRNQNRIDNRKKKLTSIQMKTLTCWSNIQMKKRHVDLISVLRITYTLSNKLQAKFPFLVTFNLLVCVK